MLPFVLRRTLRLLVTLACCCVLVFVALRVVPGDPALVVAGLDADPADVAAIRSALGTDRPLAAQMLDWAAGLVKLDFGRSLVSGEPVAALIAARLPVTLALAVAAMAVALAASVPLGVAAAARPDGAASVFSTIYAQAALAVPGFWLGILLLLAFAVALPVFPLFGADTPAHFVLPALALAAGHSAVLLRMARASVAAELGKEYVLAARARGESEGAVLFGRVLRNALPPVIALAGVQFGGLLGGAVVMEQVFSVPGFGRLFLAAVSQRDYPVVQGCALCFAFASSACSWAADLASAAANPRIALE